MPELDDADRTLDPRVVTSWRVTGAIGMCIPLVIAVTLATVFLAGALRWTIVAVLVSIAGGLLVWYPPARYARWRWRLTPLALELDHGLLVRQRESVPYFRIQQIDIVQGPLDRLLHLTTLQVTTASASGSATLGGIRHEDASGIRAALLQRAARAVADHPGDLRDAV